MGRPAKSAERNWLQGTKTQAKTPAAFVGGRPRVPRHLGPVARKAFKRAVQLLENRRTLTPSDETTLELYAQCYARWFQATNEVGTALMIETQVTDNNGNLRTVRRINPLLKIVAETEGRLLAFAKSLGFTQTDIGRCKTTAINPENEIVPGSLADTNPELFSSELAPVLQFVPIAPPTSLDDYEENENVPSDDEKTL
jgi:P27 family predicted phage terminase small subunit